MKLEIRRGRRSGLRIVCGLTLLLIGLSSCAGTKPPEPTPRLSPSQDVQAGCSESAGESLTSAAVALAARETWSARFRRNDHGASRALQRLYASTDGSLWSAQGRPTRQALALLEVLQGAGEYGLDPTDYDATRLSTLATAMLASHPAGIGRTFYRASACGDPDEAQLDLDFSAAAIALVSDLHYGRIDPRAAGFELGAPRPDDLDLANAVRTLATSDGVTRALASFEPQFEHYRLLEQALAHYRELAAANPTDAMLAGRVRKIDLTLERWRWLPAFQTPPIIVNIPEFRLFAFQQTA